MRIFTSGLKPHHRFDYVAMVTDLVRHLPPEHLRGIEFVTVSGDRPVDDDDDVLGQYYERFENEPATIVLYLDTMKREAPRLLRLLPITWKILLAQTLFHEIGHHYQRFSHGIAKHHQEDHAEAYGDRYARRAFPRWYRLLDAAEILRVRWNRLARRVLEARASRWPNASLFARAGWRSFEDEDWVRAVRHGQRALELDATFRGVKSWLRIARVRLDREARKASLAAARPQAARTRSGRRRGRRQKKKRRASRGR